MRSLCRAACSIRLLSTFVFGSTKHLLDPTLPRMLRRLLTVRVGWVCE